jgi:tRNA pseudouridine55 synthase
MDGILIIDKPMGWTSHDVVGKLRKLLKTKRIGHTGTLDPFATGVLVMLVGQATRLAQFLDKDVKEYEAVIQFGFETDTGDLTGSQKSEVRSQNENEVVQILSKTNWDEVLASFRGEILQTPPMYSAKKIEGKKLYELARKGVEIERKPVPVTIYELEVGSREARVKSPNEITIRVSCSAGTYIRTLAEDIGRKIGVPCHLSALRRTRAGKFPIESAVTLENIENAQFISMNEAVSQLPPYILTLEEAKKVRNGMSLRARFEEKSVQTVRFVDAENNLVAIGDFNEVKQQIQPRIVFNF